MLEHELSQQSLRVLAAVNARGSEEDDGVLDVLALNRRSGSRYSARMRMGRASSLFRNRGSR
jgi:hypothetical protein